MSYTEKESILEGVVNFCTQSVFVTHPRDLLLTRGSQLFVLDNVDEVLVAGGILALHTLCLLGL